MVSGGSPCRRTHSSAAPAACTLSDSPISVLDRNVTGHAMEPPLRASVSDGPPTLSRWCGGRTKPCTGGDAQNRSPTPRHHVTKNGLGEEKLCGEVAEEPFLEDPGLDVEKPIVIAGTDEDRVVHQEVDVSQFLDRSLGNRDEGFAVEKVERQRYCASTKRTDGLRRRLETPRQGSGRKIVIPARFTLPDGPCGDRDIPSIARQSKSDRLADPPACSSHQGRSARRHRWVLRRSGPG
jgi:hypothetical protein